MVKNYIIGGLLVFILFLSLCNPKKSKIEYKKGDSIYLITTDTFTETIHVPITETVYIKSEPLQVEYTHTGIDLSDTNEFKTGLRTFYYVKKDSLLDGSILVNALERPHSVNFEYSFKQKTIKDSVYVEKVISKSKLFGGGEVVVDPMMSQMYLGLDYYHKEGHLFNFSLGYDLQNKNKLIKFGYKREF